MNNDSKADKLLRKDIKMKKTVTDLPTPEEATRIFATLDLAKKEPKGDLPHEEILK